MTFTSSPRARALTLRTYCRPKDEAGMSFETWPEVIDRSTFRHHLELWDTAGGTPDLKELEELRSLGLSRQTLVSGRTQWLGGTEYARDRACCQFNCSYTSVETVFDVVDVAWLLLNGCGVGFSPRSGTLHGYGRRIQRLMVIPSNRPPDWKGRSENLETLPSGENNYTWTIEVGDSAQAWAKAIGKLFQPPRGRVDELVIDGSNVRGPGLRLKGYGWICNGFGPLAECMSAIHNILNAKAGDLLDEIDILDCINWLGTVLSSRRAAEIALLDATNPLELEFAGAKREYWVSNPQRRQSNNTELFWSKPRLARIRELLHFADECGGDPGICNAEWARKKAPWFQGTNPCGEILLSSKGFCNLMSYAPVLFRRDYARLERAVWVLARANYRQTCVDLRDDVLQPAWHQTNEALRLCGVTPTGVVQADWLTDYQIRRLRNTAVAGAYSMADELGLPRPKAVTTVTPSGTRAKISGSMEYGEVTEGIHRPLGRYIFNWVNFSVHDPLVARHASAGYRTLPNPSDQANVLVCFPVSYDNVRFDHAGGKHINLESAESQFRRYLRWSNLWCDHNASCTISYSPEELDHLASLIYTNWENGFLAVSLIRRMDPTKTAADMGHPYLPQEVVNKEEFDMYHDSLRPVDYAGVHGIYEVGDEGCVGGVCPVR